MRLIVARCEVRYTGRLAVGILSAADELRLARQAGLSVKPEFRTT